MSDTRHSPFRRLILELALGPLDAEPLQHVAELARELGLDLHAVYIEDEALTNLAGFPFARELRLPTAEWQAIDSPGLSRDLHQHAEAARRQHRQVLERMGLRGGFEVRRGDPMVCVAGVCSASDIIVVAGSANLRRPRLPTLWRAAEHSAASVLVMPERPARRGGPVVAVARQPDDRGIALADRLARLMHAPLLVLVPQQTSTDTDHTGRQGRTDQRVLPELSADEVLRALSHVPERLIVITHDAAAVIGMDDASRVAASVSVPVLVL